MLVYFPVIIERKYYTGIVLLKYGDFMRVMKQSNLWKVTVTTDNLIYPVKKKLLMLIG